MIQLTNIVIGCAVLVSLATSLNIPNQQVFNGPELFDNVNHNDRTANQNNNNQQRVTINTTNIIFPGSPGYIEPGDQPLSDQTNESLNSNQNHQNCTQNTGISQCKSQNKRPHNIVSQNSKSRVPSNRRTPPTTSGSSPLQNLSQNTTTNSAHYQNHFQSSVDAVKFGIHELSLDIQDLITRSINTMISPISLSSLLSLLSLGASGNTQHELAVALSFMNNQIQNYHQDIKQITTSISQVNRGVEITSLNRLFAANDITIHQPFTSDAKTFYNAGVQGENFKENPFEAMANINKWVSSATRGKIPHFVQKPFNRETKLVAINAVYFNGAWEIPFNKDFTFNKTFKSPTGNITLPFMAELMTISHVYDSNIDADVIGLYYKKGEFNMQFIIPKGTSNQHVLSSIDDQLDWHYVNDMVKRMKTKTASVRIPRMRLRFQGFMKPLLQRLQVHSMFNRESADFRNMAASHPLFVEDIIHETVIEITEKGTEATAISSVSLDKSGGYPVFTVDKPVIMFIRDLKNEVNLFWGKIFQPEPIQ